MSPWRAAAAFPTPLSFSRSLLRKMVAERWRISRILFELDAEGRGEALYRVETPQAAFHFYVVSDVFPAGQKIDRAFGVNWDVSAAICEGAWTGERREMLRVQVPKQYDGRYPQDVLCFCRGNRSERIFDHAVDALAASRQPDTALLASVGYLLRSTAFAGNGLFGMLPFEAMGPTHPLGATYHVQILAAYLLRTFVFDLVEHLAEARSPGASRLDPAIKRYLGVGNSAGLGLVPFIMNHPRIIHDWCHAQESAFAEALDRPVAVAALATMRALLDKARAYWRQDRRDGNGIFADYAQLAHEFDAMRQALDRIDAGPELRWRTVVESIVPAGNHPETLEALLSLVLELFPDIVDYWDRHLVANESCDLDPVDTAGRLAAAIRRDYHWLFADDGAGKSTHFWYYPLESPYEPRRGLRGTGSTFETETPMDLPRLLPHLLAALDAEPAETPVGAFLAHRPEFGLAVRRVQANAGLAYAELHTNSLASDYLPFAACRFLLAFYGMEKYDPRLPRSTKGALLQGAPLPEEVARGEEGSWPFPLAPATDVAEAPVIVPQRLVEAPEIPIGALKPLAARIGHRDADFVTVFPAEMRKLLTRAICGAGLSPAVAETAMRVAHLAGECWIDSLMAALQANPLDQMRCHGNVMDGTGLPDFAIAGTVLDLAGALAGDGIGVACGIGATPTPLLRGIASWGSRRGFLTAVADAATGGVIIAGGADSRLWQGEWAARLPTGGSGAPLDRMVAALHPIISDWRTTVRDGTPPSFAVLCERAPVSWDEAESALRALGARRLWGPPEIEAVHRKPVMGGFLLTANQFHTLSCLAKHGLVPPEFEPVVTGQALVGA